MSDKLKSWRDAVPASAAVYGRCGSGCCWHIVLEDMNVEPHHVESCILDAAQEGHLECIAFGLVARRMSRTQLGKLSRSPERLG